MSGIPHDHYEPKSGAEKWLHKRLPVVSLPRPISPRRAPAGSRWSPCRTMTERISARATLVPSPVPITSPSQSLPA